MTRYIADAGALVALFNRRDQHHAWAAKAMSELGPLWCCDAVLAEAYHLLGRVQAGDTLSKFIERGGIDALYSSADDMLRIVALMRKFKDVPMSFADACLVRMTELEPDSQVITTDTDFLVYRRHARQAVPILAPFK